MHDTPPGTGAVAFPPTMSIGALAYQQRFAAALPEAIIGCSIDELQIDRLAGASGSPQGFMDALAKSRPAQRSEA